MNYLAHAYLSFEDPEILAGNMISDFVKGKKKFDYPSRILGGIDLHRAIDAFTDAHPVNKEVSVIFQPDYGRYSLAFMDVVYDHFLAIELAAKKQDFFAGFVSSTYEKLDNYVQVFPTTFKIMLPYMKQQNWLYNYQFIQGIDKSFTGLVHRAAYLTDSAPASLLFEKYYDQLAVAYHQFFPELYQFSLNKFNDIHK